MHAACTASERLAALGSHQNMWQQKEAGPAAMMKAKVCTSLPTARKDRNRTRHSPSTASVCREGTRLEKEHPGPIPRKHTLLTVSSPRLDAPLPLRGKAQSHLLLPPPFTCWCKMVRVAGATLT